MKKVLIVDDTKNIRTLLTTCLELDGYTVSTASDGKQALEIFSYDSFDLAFLDIKMPEMSGTEVLRRLREQGIKIPVIIITAFATVKNAIECTKMGAVAYIQKPFTAEKIRSVINDITSIQSCSDAVEDDNAIEKIEAVFNSGCTDNAIETLKKALSSDPTNAEIYRLLGKAYSILGDNVTAEKFLKTYELFKNK